MSKYLIYSQATGKIWRDLDQYEVCEDGTISGGINGVNTLRYPPAVNPAVLSISDEEFTVLGTNLSKYKVVDGAVVEDPDYSESMSDKQIVKNITDLQDTTAALEDAICEMDAANDERLAAIEDALCEMDMG